MSKKKNGLTIDQCVALAHFQAFAIFEPVNLGRWIPSWTALHNGGVTNFNNSRLWTLGNHRKTTWRFIDYKNREEEKEINENVLFIKSYSKRNNATKFWNSIWSGQFLEYCFNGNNRNDRNVSVYIWKTLFFFFFSSLRHSNVRNVHSST